MSRSSRGPFDIVESISVRHEIDVWLVQLIAGIIELVLGFWAAGYYGRSAILLVAWVAAFAVIRCVMNSMLLSRLVSRWRIRWRTATKYPANRHVRSGLENR